MLPPTIYKIISFTYNNSVHLIFVSLIGEKRYLIEKTFIEIIQEYITYFLCLLIQCTLKLIFLWWVAIVIMDVNSVLNADMSLRNNEE